MVLRRISILITFLVIFTFLSTSTAFASQGEKVLFEAPVIDDLKILREKAEKRITDDPQDIHRFKALIQDQTRG